MSKETLKLALEAMNAMLTHMAMDEDEFNKVTYDQMRQAVTAAQKALAQPEQEPVRECNSIDCEYIDGLGKTDCDWCRPKKVSPPQRTWVGLTDEDKAILEAVHRELDRDCDEGNAPGHSHRTKGVWDEDNGKLAGKPCAWCLTWAKFTTLIKNEAAHGIKERNDHSI
ncbi:hypothetical protein UFOVP259_26 [uncultured Caudovirales phage]|uniref:Uncharacterized protein n=1 Tax=uncultured Caudovirales phage TaxID=2100421 RepID=A0A6J5LGF8_9CAUD|nr:hypothetical protein UFOVP259_26 [uncultured Caudovirales phage]